jgi:hypothetical protein
MQFFFLKKRKKKMPFIIELVQAANILALQNKGQSLKINFGGELMMIYPVLLTLHGYTQIVDETGNAGSN